jgi:K+/H+ antiporter YhaU regulatory subunit KhtT
MMARVMRRMSVAGNVIAAAVRRTRQETQESARRERLPRPRLHEVEEIADLKLEKFVVQAGAHAAGRTIADINLRRLTTALIVAIRRGGALLEHPNPHLPLEEGDLLFLAGSGSAIRKGVHLLEHGVVPEESSVAIKLPSPTR